jgi:hypothetical protein
MKKLTLLCVLIFTITAFSFAQGTLGKGGKQLNAGFGFSSWGTPIYVGMDFGIDESITIGPKLSYRNYSYSTGFGDVSQSLTVVSFNGNYHFNKLANLPKQWDLYAGLTLGYYMWSDAKINGVKYSGGKGSGLGLDLQIGGRYFFNDKFGVNLELGGGTGSGGSLGITYKF